MNQKFTDFDLIRFIYNETLPEETLAIKEWISGDWQIMERMHSFRIVQETLDTVHLDPSPSSIAIIMRHSHNVEELETSF